MNYSWQYRIVKNGLGHFRVEKKHSYMDDFHWEPAEVGIKKSLDGMIPHHVPGHVLWYYTYEKAKARLYQLQCEEDIRKKANTWEVVYG